MGNVVYFEQGARDWLGVPEDWAGKVPGSEPGVRYKLLTGDGAGIPGIQLVEFEPGHHEKPHSHPESEVLYVLDGEMTLGERTLRAGAGAFIEKDTVYGPLDTAAGVRFLRVGLGGVASPGA